MIDLVAFSPFFRISLAIFFTIRFVREVYIRTKGDVFVGKIIDTQWFGFANWCTVSYKYKNKQLKAEFHVPIFFVFKFIKYRKRKAVKFICIPKENKTVPAYLLSYSILIYKVIGAIATIVVITMATNAIR